MNIRPFVIFATISAAVLTANLFQWHVPIVGLIFVILYQISLSVIFSRRLFPNVSPFWKLTFGSLTFIALFSIIGSGVYWLYQWNTIAIISVIFLLPIIAALTPRVKQGERERLHIDLTNAPLEQSGSSYLIAIIIFAFQIILIRGIFVSQVTHAIVSPWEALPGWFMPLFVLTTFLLLLYYTHFKGQTRSLTLIHSIIMLGIVTLLLPLGYGFDPFIHRAAESFILENGAIYPKTHYYIGQYIPIVSLAKLVSVEWLSFFDRIFVPLMAATAIPLVSWFALGPEKKKNLAWAAVIMIFAIPFTTFIVTTPQALSNVWALLVILLGFGILSNSKVQVPLSFIWLLALASLAVHPLGGVPIVIFTTLLSVFAIKQGKAQTLKAILGFILLSISTISLPLLFLISQQKTQFATTLTQLFIKLSSPPLPWSTEYLKPLDPILDLLYAYRFSLGLILIISLMIGSYLVIKKSKRSIILLYPLFSATLLLNAALLASGIEFPFVIDYEQQNYAIRVTEVAVLFFLPFVAYSSLIFFEKLTNLPIIPKFTGIALASLALAGGLYFSYPRNNPVEIARGFTVSQSDFEAVKKISEKSSSKYVVLANQSVSSAALSTFGFTNYLTTEEGQTYFYPIPTGGKLYEFYLEMIYEHPDKKTALQAMDFAGVDQLYFVLNDYWWDADRIRNSAKEFSNEHMRIRDSIDVFIYSR